MNDALPQGQHSANPENVNGHQQRIEVKYFPVSERMQRIRGRALRRIPHRRSNSLPESAIEWNASAHMAALPVTLAATYLQAAIARFEAIAT